MNKMLIYPLIILFILAIFSQVYAFSQNTVTTIDLSYNSSTTIDSQTGQLIQNKTLTEISTSSTNAIFDINMTGGFIALIVTLIVVGVLAGIQVLGSGLSDSSVKLIYSSTVWFGLWGVFSGLTFVLFVSLQIAGLIMWFGLTLIYALGFFDKTTGGS